MKKWSKILIAIVFLILLFACGALNVVASSQAHQLLSNPLAERDPIDKTPADYALDYEEVIVANSDGQQLVGWYIPSQNGANIMVQHGYKSDRTGMLNEAEILARNGYGVLMTTVRAHDLSDGELITFGVHEVDDLDAWFDFLSGRDDVDSDKIGIMGCSMGGALVIQYGAFNEQIKAVVAQSPFSSLDDTVNTSVEVFTGLPSFPFAPMIVFWAEREAGFDSADVNGKEWIGQISPRPVLLLDGGEDTVISEDSGELLFAAANEPKEFWFEPTLGHCQFDDEMPDQFEARIIDFYNQHLLNE